MKILLTGGAGFIGSNTAAELLSAGYEVVLADDFRNSSPEVPGRIARAVKGQVDVAAVDVTDRAAVEQVFRSYPIGAVVHFAALKAVGESVERPLEYYLNNLDGLLTVLEVMREHGVKTLIYSSSAAVYGGGQPMPLAETAAVGPCTNPYGRTKLMCEQILRDAAAADPALSVMLLRYFNPVGGHGSGLLGERPQGVPNNLMPYIVQAAAGVRDRLYIFGGDYPTPDGTGVRDYIHVTDLARGHVAALEHALTHTGVETVNLGTGRGTSVLELVHAFQRVNGVRVPYMITDRRPGDVPACWAAVDRAKALLGWTAEKSLEDMGRDSWNSRA